MAKRVLTNMEFVTACGQVSSIEELAEKTGLTKTTCQQKRVKLKGEGWTFPEFKRGAGGAGARKPKGPTAEELAELAKLRGVTVEQLQTEAEDAKVKQAERSAKIKAGQAASKVVDEQSDPAPEGESTESAPEGELAETVA
jgi:hypothetical protein